MLDHAEIKLIIHLPNPKLCIILKMIDYGLNMISKLSVKLESLGGGIRKGR